MGKTISVGLCGDFWHNENVEKMRRVDCDFVLWPVFVDDEIFGADNWAESKFDYASQAKQVHSNVLMINSITETPSHALGGCAYFKDGYIDCELSPNTNGLLLIHL